MSQRVAASILGLRTRAVPRVTILTLLAHVRNSLGQEFSWIHSVASRRVMTEMSSMSKSFLACTWKMEDWALFSRRHVAETLGTNSLVL